VGNFYANITLRGTAEEVVPILRALRRNAYVGFSDGFAVVCDEECDKQDLDAIASLAVTLSSRLGRAALSVLNHDDDALLFGLFAEGTLASEYGVSTSRALTVPKTSRREFVRRVHAELQTKAVPRELAVPWWIRWLVARIFLMLRHEELAAELGLPALSVGAGFRYVDRDDVPRGKKADFVIV
jgi:hypothetical protein